jgi:hypothetical protein
VRAGAPIANGQTIPQIQVSPIGHINAKRVFYETMRRPETASFPDFLRMKAASEAVARDMLGEAFSLSSVRKGWEAVGVGTGCSVPPQAAPVIAHMDYMCRGRHDLSWPDVTGATTYHGERVRAGYPWDLATPIVDGYVHSCSQNVSVTSYARVRACNGCGCSPWSSVVVLKYYSVCP